MSETSETPANAPEETVVTTAAATTATETPKETAVDTAETEETPDIFALFESDPDAEDKGVWMHLGRSGFRVRSFNSPAVQKVIEAQRKRQARILNQNNGVLPEAIRQKNSAETTAAMVTEWKEVPDPATRNGAMECSQDNKMRLFSIRELRNLQNRIWQFSLDAENYRKAETERLEGNS